MQNTRVLLRIVASTLATAGLVLGAAAASVSAPSAASVHHSSKDTGWKVSANKDTGWKITASRDTGW
jgi:hypothetical protein